MANNRMGLYCKVCKEDFQIAKYYPHLTTGWFTTVNSPGAATDLEVWLQKHSYCDTAGKPSEFGNRAFSILFEEPYD